MARVDVIEALVDAAFLGMKDLAEHATAGEVTSAGFTLCARLISVAMDLNPAEAPHLRAGCHELLLRCTDMTTIN
jgi:hypothetical protein